MNLSAFNPAQKEAITLPIDPAMVPDILIVAGAGSGKTRVLVHRIAYLRGQGVPSSSILALTFTKKAANEMQGRLFGLLGATDPVKMSTFHSLAADLLRTYRQTPFDIIDDNDQGRLIKGLIKDHGWSEMIQFKAFKTWFSYQRNMCLKPERPGFDDKPVVQLFRQLAAAYQKAKKQLGPGVLDFDDLLEELITLLDGNSTIRQQLHQRWKYILVDEYQDTNRLQYRILSLLRGEAAQLLQVGDEDQLIYSWRGAEIEHIMTSYAQSLKSGRVRCVMLKTNYRCSANILALANRVVSVNANRTGKALDAHREKGEPVSLLTFLNCYQEGDSIASQLARWNAQGVPFSEMAVLMRTNRMARSLERALITEGIPYHMHNGVAIFDSREVRLIMSLLRFTDDPSETFYLQEFMDTIKTGLGPSALSNMDAERREAGENWITYFSKNAKALSRPRIKELLLFFPEARGHLAAGELLSAAKSWLNNWELMSFYKPDEREKKAETLNVFFAVLEDYEHQAVLRKVKPTVMDFQEQRLLNDALTDKEPADAVHLMTVHKAKGLEFRRGAIMGMQDGVFPLSPGTTDGDPEEDCRLAYVAITRFMEELVITRTYKRVGFNQITGYSTLLDPHIEKLEKSGVVSHGHRAF